MNEILVSCAGCGLPPATCRGASSYRDCLEHGQTEEDYVRAEEGTFNPETGAFWCDVCYVLAGMPLGKAVRPARVREGTTTMFGREAKAIIIDSGDTVICDSCNADWTNRPESGGILVGSYGYCPDCAGPQQRLLEVHGESRRITARCPPGMSHANWIRRVVRAAQ